ncbi:DUF2752 domain-containing protein [bacterium]|nr:DUF2752 domain-containing protein [bacterium]MBQ6436453.1 DUF2752 domain-containing protein [bacterium]
MIKLSPQTKNYLSLAFIAVLLAFAVLPENFWYQTHLDLCLWHQLFGVHCLGCGTLRALSHLAHGHFWLSLKRNPLALCSCLFEVMLLGSTLKSNYQIFTRKKT